MVPLLFVITTLCLSFSVDDFGCHATRYFPLWYLLYNTLPLMGLRFTCTLAGLIKMLTCMRLSLKYSSSVISSITTTLPSAGQIICSSETVRERVGIRKNETIKRNKNNVTMKIAAVSQGRLALRKKND